MINRFLKYAINTTLLVTSIYSANSMEQDLPDGMKLSEKCVKHPIFGKMKVISHKKDIEYYNKESYDADDEKELVKNFLKYVVDNKSFSKAHGIKKHKLKKTLEYLASSDAGENMLKVITAKYMRKYNAISDFCHDNRWYLENYAELNKKQKKHYSYKLEKKIKSLRSDLEDDLKKHGLTTSDVSITKLSEICSEKITTYMKTKYIKSALRGGLTPLLISRTIYTESCYEHCKENHIINLSQSKKSDEYYYSYKSKSFLPTDKRIETYKVGKIKITSKYQSLHHEMLHFMNELTLKTIGTDSTKYFSNKQEDLWHDKKFYDTKTKIKKTFKKNFQDSNTDTLKYMLEYVFPEVSESLAMYGIAQYNGKFYYEPINEAMMDAKGFMYNGKKKKLVRLGHVRAEKYKYSTNLQDCTKIYDWYFDKKLDGLCDL